MVKTVNTREIRDARLDAELEQELKEFEVQKNKVKEEADGTQLSDEEKSWKKRHGDLRSFSQKKENELTKKIEALEAQLVEATKKQIKFPKTEEEFDNWREKYPDVSAMMQMIAMKENESLRRENEERNQKLQERAYQVELDRWTNEIVKAHSDFYSLREDEQFIEWVRKQPRAIRAAFDDNLPFNDIEDAANTIISAIKFYKAETKPTKPVNTAREAARNVLPRETRTAPRDDRGDNLIYESEIMKLNRYQYTDEVDAEVQKAMREGRFVADVSGAAR